jgi:SAM-dependent methyltransferase
MSIKFFRNFLRAFGFDPLVTYRSLKALPFFLFECISFRRSKNLDSEWPLFFSFPCLADRYDHSGVATGHYFHQDLYIAQCIFKNNPSKHIDVGSRVDGLVAHLATFRPVSVIDIRRLNVSIDNIQFIRADLMKPLSASLQNSCDSLSCLHAIEHFGLGRYGDNLDFYGHLKGIDNLYSLLKKDGILYFSVPMGPQRIEFNAHRVFSLKTILRIFADRFHICQFSYVDDSGSIHRDVQLTDELVLNNCYCNYGLAIFEFKKY